MWHLFKRFLRKLLIYKRLVTKYDATFSAFASSEEVSTAQNT